MKKAIFISLIVNAIIFICILNIFLLSCGEPKGPGKTAGDEANSQQMNTNDYPSTKDTVTDMSSGGGVGPDIYKADTIANKGKEQGGSGH